MELTEHIAEYLRTNGFPDATSGQMPESPSRNVTVYATGIYEEGSDEPSRFQIIARSEPNADTAIMDIMNAIRLLDKFQGITSINSPYFVRIASEGGAANMGVDSNNRLMYSANFTCLYC